MAPDDLIRTDPLELEISNWNRRDSRLTVVGDSITLTTTMMLSVLPILMKEKTCWVEVRPVEVKLWLALRQEFSWKASVCKGHHFYET